jgi:cytidylate kinase
MIVTLDGPAGAGKSTVARMLAQRLGFRFLDTGAMYRAVAWAGQKNAVDWTQPVQLIDLAAKLRIEFTDTSVLVDGQDVTSAIRTPDITSITHYSANNPGVRAIMVDQQRQLAGVDDLVTEGRDQGTVVFPKAECKIFRRARELAARGERIAYEELLAEQNLRDARDSSRSVGPLAQAVDAILIPTDGLELDQVVARLEEVVRKRISEIAKKTIAAKTRA